MENSITEGPEKAMKLAIITSQSLREPTAAALARLQKLQPDYETVLLAYENFAQLPALYDEYAPSVDGFLVSGQVTLAAIERKEHAVRKPLLHFQADTAELYKSILQYVLAHPGADIGRIVLDFLLPLKGGCSAQTFLDEMELPMLESQVSGWVGTMQTDHLEQLESSIASRIVEMWESGKVDMVICLYGSIAPVLRAHGIPFECPLVEDMHLLDLLRRLQVTIELNRLRANMPAVVSASPRGKEAAAHLDALQEKLELFLRENLLDCMLQKKRDHCEFFTSVSVVQYLTDHAKTSRLSSWLDEELAFPTAVGYGIGVDINQAMLNAQAARKESEFVGKSFIRNEKEALIGPLGTAKAMVVEYGNVQGVGEIARRCGLSTLTIQKVAASMKQSGSQKITTQELAGRFGVTVRNANRILGRLVEGGYARVAYFQTANSKGRPVKVYELMLDAKQ